MAGIETLSGVARTRDHEYEITSIVSVGTGIDDVQNSNFILKNGGFLIFTNGCNTVFTRCTFHEFAGAGNSSKRFSGDCQVVFRGCKWIIENGRQHNFDIDVNALTRPEFRKDEYGLKTHIFINNLSNSYNNHFDSSTMIIDGLVIDQRGIGGVAEFRVLPSISDFQLVDNDPGSANRHAVFLMAFWPSGSTYTIRNLSARNIAAWEGNSTKTIVLEDPLGNIFKSTDNIRASQGNLVVNRTYKFECRDSTNSPISPKTYLRNTDNNEVYINAITPSVSQPLFYYEQVAGSTTVNTQANYIRGVYLYGYLPSSRTLEVSERIDGSPIDDGIVLLVNNMSITEPIKSTVEAYELINTSNRFYDLFCALFQDIYAGEQEIPITISGNELNVGSYHVNIDPNLVQNMELTGNIISVKASEFSGIIISPQGVVNLQNGARILGGRDGGIIDSVSDSYLYFIGITSWEAFASAEDQNTDQNVLAYGSVNDVYRFNFIPNQTIYLRLYNAGSPTFYTAKPTESGSMEIYQSDRDLIKGVSKQLSFIPSNVFVDTSLLETGTGSGYTPFNNITGALTHAFENKISQINFKGNIQIQNMITDTKFVSLSPFYQFDPNGNDISQCQVHLANVVGDFGTSQNVVVRDSTATDLTNFNGILHQTAIYGKIDCDGITSIFSCYSGTQNATINLTQETNVFIRDFSGNLTISGVAFAGALVEIHTSGTVTIDPSCTGGQINIYGITDNITDNSDGSIVSVSKYSEIPTESKVRQISINSSLLN